MTNNTSDNRPADEKPEPPKTLLQKIGPAFAIAMTALAAIFGSMSAAQLQQAMYWKSQAAQDQSKSANQWGLFGFKRSRALEMEAAAAKHRADAGYLRVRFATTGKDGEAGKWLNPEGGPPRTEVPKPENENLVKLIEDIRARKPEAEILALAAQIPIADINKAIDDAENFVADTEGKWGKVTDAAKELAKPKIEAAERTAPKDTPPDKLDEANRAAAAGPTDPAKKATADAVQAQVYAMEEKRYRAEGRLNQALGYLYEARVKFSTAESDAHRKKSELLGYAMLVAQIGAVAASLALARRGGTLWIVVAVIGLGAVGFGGYALVPAGLLQF